MDHVLAPQPQLPAPRASRALLTLLFFASGAVGLGYEVAWTRALHRIVGSTPAGSALVLAAFMGALGLGARWSAARSERSARPLARYGAFELAAAAWALLVLPLADLLSGPYVALAQGSGEGLRLLLRTLVTALLVMPGAFLLGATLPAVVSAWLAGAPAGPRPSRAVPWLYGVNTLGAVAGALATGFLAVDALGVRGTLFLAAGLGLAVGVLALALARPVRAAGTLPPVLDAAPLHGPALLAAAATGFLGLAVEVVGFRLLTFFVEGFTTSFAAMLGVFILGLGLGSLVGGPWSMRVRRPARALSLLLALLGLVLLTSRLVVLPEIEGWLRSVRGWAYADARTAGDLLAGHRLAALAGAAALLLLPALLLGPAFTLAVRWAQERGAGTPRALGAVYLANSAGSLLGAPYAAFVLMAHAGVLDAWLALAVLALLAALTLPARRAWVRATLPVALLAGGALLLLTGPGGGDGRLLAWSHVLAGRPERTLRAVRTDAVTVASVVSAGEQGDILYTDDFAAAATGPNYRYMQLLGHLPVLLAREPVNALVIAFGTGTTAGAVAAHPEVRRLEVAEVSRAVIDLAPWFSAWNGGVLEDPRTRLLVDDGRDALQLHAPDLDVITLEPLMPYSPAGLPFYTREFYELARDRLREGGVLCQWVPVHAMPVGMYAALLRTFFEVFPEGSLWFFEQSTALVGRKGAAAPDRAVLAAREAAAAGRLAEAGFASVDLLASAFVAGGAELLSAEPPDPDGPWRRVTDLDPWPEFHATPRGVSTSYLADTLFFLQRLCSAAQRQRDPLGAGLRVQGRTRSATQAALEARVLEALAERLPASASTERLARLDDAVRRYGEALERLPAPGDPALLWRRARAQRGAAALRVGDLFTRARQARGSGRPDEARDLERAAAGWALQALRVDDGDPVAGQRGAAALLHALTLLRLGRCAAAERTLADVRALLPEGAEARLLSAWMRAVAALRAGGAAQPPLPPDLPACRAEGVEPVALVLRAWREALLANAPLRAQRLATRNLVEAALAEACEDAVLAEARAFEPGSGALARVQRALVLRRLDPGDAALDALLDGGEAEALVALLGELGASKGLRRLPAARLTALLGAPDARVRAALAEAAGTDGGEREVRAAIALLADPDRSVRVAAAAALLGHDAEQGLTDYDPDGPPEGWARVIERLRRG